MRGLRKYKVSLAYGYEVHHTIQWATCPSQAIQYASIERRLWRTAHGMDTNRTVMPDKIVVKVGDVS